MKKLVSIFLCAAMLFSLAACADNSNEAEKETTNEGTKDYLVLDEGRISVVSMENISGLFVEQGKQDEVENVVALIVRNNSEKMLEYGVISFRVNEFERADFKISALPAGESVIVMETLARSYSEEDKYVIDYSVNQTYFSYTDASVDSEKAELSIDGSEISVMNLTDSALNATVVYKYFKDGMYYGGIAFRGSFEKIAAGETMSKSSSRFNDTDCKIVNLITE